MQARHLFLEAHALQHKPVALISAANMALKLREASTAKREYELVTRAHPPLYLFDALPPTLHALTSL